MMRAITNPYLKAQGRLVSAHTCQNLGAQDLAVPTRTHVRGQTAHDSRVLTPYLRSHATHEAASQLLHSGCITQHAIDIQR